MSSSSEVSLCSFLSRLVLPPVIGGEDSVGEAAGVRLGEAIGASPKGPKVEPPKGEPRRGDNVAPLPYGAEVFGGRPRGPGGMGQDEGPGAPVAGNEGCGNIFGTETSKKLSSTKCQISVDKQIERF